MGSHRAIKLSSSSWTSFSSFSADGIGYATCTGFLDDERAVVEASSGGIQEYIQHTAGDTIKLLESMTCMLALKASKVPNARFSTLQNYKAISIHVIKRTMTLTVLWINENKKFVIEERRTAEIPIQYTERYKWLQVMELLVHMKVSHTARAHGDRLLITSCSISLKNKRKCTTSSYKSTLLLSK